MMVLTYDTCIIPFKTTKFKRRLRRLRETCPRSLPGVEYILND